MRSKRLAMLTRGRISAPTRAARTMAHTSQRFGAEAGLEQRRIDDRALKAEGGINGDANPGVAAKA